MDIEVFVAKVYQRTPIWNKWDKDHADRNVVHKLWAEISKEMNCEETQLRKKWKYLRDQYSVELGKLKPSRSGDGAGEKFQCKWKYFALLDFLKDVVKPRASTGNLSSLLTDDTTVTLPQESVQEDCQTTTNEQHALLHTKESISLGNSSGANDSPDNNDHVLEEQCSICHDTLTKKRHNKCCKPYDFNQSMLDIEQEKVQYLKDKMKCKQDGDDDDLMFLKSLLPHIREIPKEQKLMFRNRVMEVVQEFAYTPRSKITPQSNYGYSSSATTYTPQISPYGSFVNSPTQQSRDE